MLYGVLLFVMAIWTVDLPTSQKPVVDSPIIADSYNLPSTLQGMVERVDAVVVARITRAKDVSHGQRARTDYEFQLVSVTKEHPNLSGRSIICRAIGTVEYPTRIVRVFQPQLPSFEPGKEYLLFLGWDEGKGCFFPAFGPPGSAFVDATEGVKPFVNHPALGELKGLKGVELAKRLAQAWVRR